MDRLPVTWRDQIRRIVTDREELRIIASAWAKTHNVTEDEVLLCIAEYRSERDAIDVLKARPENPEVGQ
jgi:hypothetical protein